MVPRRTRLLIGRLVSSSERGVWVVPCHAHLSGRRAPFTPPTDATLFGVGSGVACRRCVRPFPNMAWAATQCTVYSDVHYFCCSAPRSNFGGRWLWCRFPSSSAWTSGARVCASSLLCSCCRGPPALSLDVRAASLVARPLRVVRVFRQRPPVLYLGSPPAPICVAVRRRAAVYPRCLPHRLLYLWTSALPPAGVAASCLR